MMPRCDQLRLALGGELLILGVRRVARELRFGLREQRLVARQVGFGLRERRLERPPIEREELLALLDEVAFVERDFAAAGRSPAIGPRSSRTPRRCRSRRCRPARPFRRPSP